MVLFVLFPLVSLDGLKQQLAMSCKGNLIANQKSMNNAMLVSIPIVDVFS